MNDNDPAAPDSQLSRDALHEAPVPLAAERVRAGKKGRVVSGEVRAIITIALIILAANFAYLFSVTDPNPLGPRSQLATDRLGLISGDNTLDPTDGYITQALGRVAANDILNGQLPLWNPYEGLGMPLLGEGQSAALFPPTLLLALDNGQFYEDLLLELLAGISTFLVLRRIGIGTAASVAGGTAFALNGAFAWLATTSFNPVAFLPLLILGLEQAYRASAQRRSGAWWLIAVALALSLYAGFPETTYIDSLVALLWFLWRCGCVGRPRLRPFVLKCAAGSAAGLLLAAPFLIAFLGTLPYEFVGFHNGNAAALTMPSFSFPQMVLPYVYGPPFAFSDPAGIAGTIWGYTGGFVPISLLFLGASSYLSASHRGLKLLLGAWALLALSAMYGQPPLLRDVLSLLPGGTSVAFYRYSVPALTFAFAVLAALGIDGVARGRIAGGRVVLPTAGMLALTGLLAFEAHRLVTRLSGGSSHSFWAWGQIVWAVGAVGLIGAVAWRKHFPSRWLTVARPLLLASLVVVDVAAMFTLHELSAPRAVKIDRAPIVYLQRHLGSGRFFTLGPVAPNYGGYWDLASLNDIDLPLPSAWTAYVKTRLDPAVNPVFFVGSAGGGRLPSSPTPQQELLAHLSAYRASDVNYVVTPPGQVLPQGRRTFRLVLRDSGAWIYRLAGGASYFSTSMPCATSGTVRNSVQVTCSHPAMLVRRELAFPGWSASLDGRPVRVRTADGVFQSVALPPGSHTVSFTYAPPHFNLSLIAFFLGAAWLAGAGLISLRPGVRGVPRN